MILTLVNVLKLVLEANARETLIRLSHRHSVLISLTKTKTKIVVNENTLESLTKTKIETKILAKTIKKR